MLIALEVSEALWYLGVPPEESYAPSSNPFFIIQNMTRVKRGFVARKRRKRVLKLAKGFRGSHSVLFRTAQQRTMRALSLSYSDGRLFKRAMRRLWIRRLNSALRNIEIQRGTPPAPSPGVVRFARYSSFIHTLKKAKSLLNRKVLSQLAVLDPKAFQTFVTNL